MTQGKRWIDRRTAIGAGLACITVPLLGCAHRQESLGFSLSFFNRGTRPLTTKRFDFDGQSGTDPGYLGPGGGGKHMSFMPGDRKGGIPKFVEAEWILHSEEYSAWSKRTPSPGRYSKENREIFQKLWDANPHYTQRVDLAPILTPELIEQVCADRKNTQLKMTVIYRDDKVEITASTYKWR